MSVAAPVAAAGLVSYGVAGRALPGERESGDLHLVTPFHGGVLVALADGLGHGSEAALAARAAMASLSECPQLPVDELMARCHAALYKTRGVVLGLASIDAVRGELTWTGVGNINAILIRLHTAAPPRREALASRGGVVGHQMPRVHLSTYAIGPGDMLVLVTDGIDGAYRLGTSTDWLPQELADDIVARHVKESDDALALVVRYAR